MERYDGRIERRMTALFGSLSEKDRRRYAAVEADKLGHGGTAYISELFGIDPKTIRQGKADLDLSDDPASGADSQKRGAARGSSKSRRSSTNCFSKSSLSTPPAVRSTG